MLLCINCSLSFYPSTYTYIYLCTVQLRMDIKIKCICNTSPFMQNGKSFFFAFYKGIYTGTRHDYPTYTIKIRTQFAPDNSVIIHFTLWLSQFYSKERYLVNFMCVFVVVAAKLLLHNTTTLSTYIFTYNTEHKNVTVRNLYYILQTVHTISQVTFITISAKLVGIKCLPKAPLLYIPQRMQRALFYVLFNVLSNK